MFQFVPMFQMFRHFQKPLEMAVKVQFLTNSPPEGVKKFNLMTNQTFQAVKNTLAAIDASEYIVRIVQKGKPSINREGLDPCQLIKEIPYYQAKNFEEYNIYFRPVGYQYVLLDDLNRSTLFELAKLKPCLLLETSPGNYQAWVKLRDVPQEKEDALAICKEMAAMFDADMASAEPVHVGRLPGFTNRKPKHRRPDGQFPFVKLHKWEDRESDFSPLGGAVGQIDTHRVARNQTKDRDRSQEDFNLCCMLINQGKKYEEVRQQLEATSQKGKEVSPRYDYYNVTVRNAFKRMMGNQTL